MRDVAQQEITPGAFEDIPRAPVTFRFEVFRYDSSRGEAPRLQAYELEVRWQTSVLEGLLRIQGEQDPSLAFRYCCRGAICGSCGMMINGRPELACRTQLHRLNGRRVVLEPLPGFEVLQDLVVDMQPFWDKYERVQPWVHGEETAAEPAHWTDSQRERVDAAARCILCGLCHAACPAMRSNSEFTGPAALAHLDRFRADPREHRDAQTIEQEDSRRGVWGCHTIMRCNEVCPKDVRPSDGIRGLRRQLLGHRIGQLFGRGRR